MNLLSYTPIYGAHSPPISPTLLALFPSIFIEVGSRMMYSWKNSYMGNCWIQLKETRSLHNNIAIHKRKYWSGLILKYFKNPATANYNVTSKSLQDFFLVLQTLGSRWGKLRMRVWAASANRAIWDGIRTGVSCSGDPGLGPGLVLEVFPLPGLPALEGTSFRI